MSKIPQEAIDAGARAIWERIEDEISFEKACKEKHPQIEWTIKDAEVCIEAADAAREQGAEVEPFMYGIMEPDGSTFWDEDLCVSSDRYELEDIIEDRGMAGHKVVALYAHSPAPQPTDREKVLEEIAAERARQITGEGWTPEHDDHHDSGEMAEAAAGYALKSTGTYGNPKYPPNVWPWDIGWWKPTTPRRDLVKAAALLVAEIERLDRAALAGGEA